MNWKVCPKCNEELRQIDSNNHICEKHGVYNISYLAGVRDGTKGESKRIVEIIDDMVPSLGVKRYISVTELKDRIKKGTQ